MNGGFRFAIPNLRQIYLAVIITNCLPSTRRYQFFANVYLNPLDQYIKHELKCRHYVRYVDDLVLLSPNRQELEYWESQVVKFLKSQLNLELNHKRRKMAPVKNGCNFLGYIIRPSHLIVRKRIVNNLKHKLAQYEKQLKKEWNGTVSIRHDPQIIEQLQSVMASYLGHFNHASTYNLNKFIFNRFSFLLKIFKYENGKLSVRFKPPRFGNLKHQYQWFNHKFKDAFIFFEVGYFFEFFGSRAEIASKALQLNQLSSRPRLGMRVGFPVYRLNDYLKLALSFSDRVIIVRQTGRYSGRLMERRVFTELLNET